MLLEDDAYPETYIDLKILFSQLEKPRFRNLRKSIKHFNQQIKLITENEIIDNKPLKNQMLEFLSDWSNDDIEKFNSYNGMIKYATMQRRKGVYTFVFQHESKILGIYIIGDVGNKGCGLYCGITTRDYKGGVEALDMKVYEFLKSIGYERVFVGGSETIGVFNYLKKFSPLLVPYKVFSLIYKP